ncbi:hypothetical protein ACFOPS_02590 [Ralstonia solanacearum]|uniref:hypothetical protein n=1 Tax=Ralstonia solanacearum TaxID=305 RepID=UPI00361C29A3
MRKRPGAWKKALVLLNELKAMGSDDPMMRPNVVTYSAAISACEKAGRAIMRWRCWANSRCSPAAIRPCGRTS